jgi:hypothetical protein
MREWWEERYEGIPAPKNRGVCCFLLRFYYAEGAKKKSLLQSSRRTQMQILQKEKKERQGGRVDELLVWEVGLKIQGVV